jgi:hypothetical protein
VEIMGAKNWYKGSCKLEREKPEIKLLGTGEIWGGFNCLGTAGAALFLDEAGAALIGAKNYDPRRSNEFGETVRGTDEFALQEGGV